MQFVLYSYALPSHHSHQILSVQLHCINYGMNGYALWLSGGITWLIRSLYSWYLLYVCMLCMYIPCSIMCIRDWVCIWVCMKAIRSTPSRMSTLPNLTTSFPSLYLLARTINAHVCVCVYKRLLRLARQYCVFVQLEMIQEVHLHQLCVVIYPQGSWVKIT